MRTSIQILPGIKSIGWVDSRHLPDRIFLSAICGMMVAVMTTINDIPFFNEATCECVTKKEGAGYEDTASLKFSTCSELPNSPYLAFVVTDVNDKSYIIGSKEKPLAVVKPTRTTGNVSSNPSCIEYEITHVSIKSMVPCVV